MHVTAPVYEKPSQLSQGLVVGLSIAVVLMAGWLAATIIFSEDITTAAEGSTDAAANMPVPAAASPPADRLPRNAGTPPAAAAASSGASAGSGQAARSVQFDWPAEFDAKPAPPPARTALPFAPTTDLPAARAPWPAAASVPDNARAFTATRQPAQAGVAANATDAIVELLSPPPPSGIAPSPRTAPTRR